MRAFLAGGVGRLIRAKIVAFLAWRARVHGQRFRDYCDNQDYDPVTNQGLDCGASLRLYLSTHGNELLNKRNKAYDKLAKWDREFKELWDEAPRDQ